MRLTEPLTWHERAENVADTDCSGNANSDAGVTPCVTPNNDDDALLIDNLFRASLGRDSDAIDKARMALRQRMNELRTRGVAAAPVYRCACGYQGNETKPWRGIGICCPKCEGRLYLASASGVASVDRVQRLIDAIEGECDGLAVDEQHARAILAYVDGVSGTGRETVSPSGIE